MVFVFRSRFSGYTRKSVNAAVRLCNNEIVAEVYIQRKASYTPEAVGDSLAACGFHFCRSAVIFLALALNSGTAVDTANFFSDLLSSSSSFSFSGLPDAISILMIL